jgi:hypothetical protein
MNGDAVCSWRDSLAADNCTRVLVISDQFGLEARRVGAVNPPRPRLRARAPPSGVGSASVRISASLATSAYQGERWQTGSVARAAPVSARAWQRQPPKSSNRRGQLAHGSRIQSVPRNALKAGDDCQI